MPIGIGVLTALRAVYFIGSDDSGYGIPSQLVQRRLDAAAARTEPVSTGGCAR